MALPEKQFEIKNMKDEIEIFKNDVLRGFAKAHKQIPSYYLYDEKGSELYTEITKHPDYYLTNCEIEILEKNKTLLASLFKNNPFNLIEFGPGEGIKTLILIKQFLKENLDFIYYPIDISKQYLHGIVKEFQHKFPNLKVEPKSNSYLEGLERIKPNANRKNLLMFLGSSIGNLDPDKTREFLDKIFILLNHGDYFMIGFDLCKDINLMHQAYNDSDNITREFNLNLLTRMNRELQANFVLENFSHYSGYNPKIRAMESYLLSLQQQEVTFRGLQKSYILQPFEAIQVEFSYKYLLPQIYHLAHHSGFKVVENFFDSKNYFVDSLWQVNKNN